MITSRESFSLARHQGVFFLSSYCLPIRMESLNCVETRVTSVIYIASGGTSRLPSVK
ncbi:MAG: hypothetical protein ACTSXH_19375 [Promethearchaeota archaeon]